MPESRATRKARLILRMEKDRVGLFVGALAGFVVMLACAFWAHADIFETMIRVGLTFTVAYLAAFMLIHVIQMVAGPELKPKRPVLPLGPPGADQGEPVVPPGENEP